MLTVGTPIFMRVRSMCLALHDHAAWQSALALVDVANSQVDQATAVQLAVDGKVEQIQVSHLFRKLEPQADCPDFLQLERRLLSDWPTLVPRNGQFTSPTWGFIGFFFEESNPIFARDKGCN